MARILLGAPAMPTQTGRNVGTGWNVRRLGGWALAATLLGGCGGSDAPVSSDEANFEELEVLSAPELLRCAITKGEGDVVEDRVDTVRCEATQPPESYPVSFILTVNGTAGSKPFGAFVKPGEPLETRLWADKGYPVTIKLEAIEKSPLGEGVVGIGHASYEQTVTLTEPTAEPVVFEAPFDYWPLVLEATSATAFVEIAPRELSLASWTLGGQSATTFSTFTTAIQPGAAKKIFLPVVPGTEAVQAKAGTDHTSLYAATFEGPGRYVIGAAKMERASGGPVEPAPGPVGAASWEAAPREAFLACFPGATTVDGQEVFCEARPVEGVAMRLDGIYLLDGSSTGPRTKPTASGEPVSVGRCTAASCSVRAWLAIERIGTTETPMLIGDVEVPLGEGASAEAPSTLRLPFDVWEITVDPRGQDLIANMDEVDSPLDPTWKPAHPPASSVGGASVRATGTEPVTVFVPAPPGTAELTGKATVIYTTESGAKDTHSAALSLRRDGSYFVNDAHELEASPE